MKHRGQTDGMKKKEIDFDVGIKINTRNTVSKEILPIIKDDSKLSQLEYLFNNPILILLH